MEAERDIKSVGSERWAGMSQLGDFQQETSEQTGEESQRRGWEGQTGAAKASAAWIRVF